MRRANTDKEVNFVKRADKPVIFVVMNGNNNKFYAGGKHSRSAAIVIALSIVVTLAVLMVSLYCPDLLADFVRWIVGIAIGS